MTAAPHSANVTSMGNPSIPRFEGLPVAALRVKISGLSQITGDDGDVMPVFSVDDRVRLVGEFKCVGVRHYVDPKNGEVIREQILAPIGVTTCPWDPQDPADDGVVRAR